jgi:hypothetical protein
VHALLQGGRRQLRVASAGLVGHRDTSVQLAQLVLVMVIRRPCGLASGAGTGGLVRLWVVRAGPLRPGAVRSRRPRR